MSRPTGDSPPRMRGATASVAGSRGIVPKPTAGQHTFMLLGDGTWGAQPIAGLPSQTSNSGKLLTTDGTNASWTTTGVLTTLTSPAATNLTLGLGTGGTALTLASSTLAATFAGAVTVGGKITSAVSTATGYNQLYDTTGLTTGRGAFAITSTGAGLAFGVESSVGGTSFTGSTAYASYFGTTTATPIHFVTNSVIRQTIDSTGAATFAGAVTVATGNLVIGTAGNGIDFSATAGTGTSELLNDYEEGTWTPTLTPITSGTITLNSPNLCAYTKIGRVVTVNGLIDTASVSTPIGGSVSVNNLPFTSNATATQRSAGTAACLNMTSGFVSTACTIVQSTTTMVLQINASLFQTGSAIFFQLTYTV